MNRSYRVPGNERSEGPVSWILGHHFVMAQAPTGLSTQEWIGDPACPRKRGHGTQFLYRLIAWIMIASPVLLLAADIVPASASDRPAIDSKELMRLGGIGPDAWARFQDGPPLTEPERETLQKILFRLAGLPVEQLERLAAMPIDWQHFRNDPASYRGKLVQLNGQVRSVDVVRLPKSWADRFGVRQCYRVVMDVDDTHQPVTIYTRKVPKAWRTGRSIDQTAAAWAMFIKLENDGAGRAQPVFAAPRLAWYPKDRLLGQLGMDVGLLDDLVDRQPIRSEERECFYQALAAVGRAEPDQLEKAAGTSRSVEPLFNKPVTQRGKLITLSGTAKRVLRVRVDVPDIQRRLGIDHYYEIHLYTGDSQGNPLVFCVPRLPEGMPVGDGPNYAEPVSVTGFFLKSWAYPSQRSGETDRGDSREPLQLAPLLVGRDVVWHHSGRHDGSSIWGTVGAGLFVLVLLVIWLWLLNVGRNDRKRRRASRTASTTGFGADPDQPAEELGRILDPSTVDENNSSDK